MRRSGSFDNSNNNQSSSNSISNIGGRTLGQEHQTEAHLKEEMVSLLTLGVRLSTLGTVRVNLRKVGSILEPIRDIALEVVKLVGIYTLILRWCVTIVKKKGISSMIVRRNIPLVGLDHQSLTCPN